MSTLSKLAVGSDVGTARPTTAQGMGGEVGTNGRHKSAAPQQHQHLTAFQQRMEQQQARGAASVGGSIAAGRSGGSDARSQAALLAAAIAGSAHSSNDVSAQHNDEVFSQLMRAALASPLHAAVHRGRLNENRGATAASTPFLGQPAAACASARPGTASMVGFSRPSATAAGRQAAAAFAGLGPPLLQPPAASPSRGGPTHSRAPPLHPHPAGAAPPPPSVGPHKAAPYKPGKLLTLQQLSAVNTRSLNSSGAGVGGLARPGTAVSASRPSTASPITHGYTDFPRPLQPPQQQQQQQQQVGASRPVSSQLGGGGGGGGAAMHGRSASTSSSHTQPGPSTSGRGGVPAPASGPALGNPRALPISRSMPAGQRHGSPGASIGQEDASTSSAARQPRASGLGPVGPASALGSVAAWLRESLGAGGGGSEWAGGGDMGPDGGGADEGDGGSAAQSDLGSGWRSSAAAAAGVPPATPTLLPQHMGRYALAGMQQQQEQQQQQQQQQRQQQRQRPGSVPGSEGSRPASGMSTFSTHALALGRSGSSGLRRRGQPSLYGGLGIGLDDDVDSVDLQLQRIRVENNARDDDGMSICLLDGGAAPAGAVDDMSCSLSALDTISELDVSVSHHSGRLAQPRGPPPGKLLAPPPARAHPTGLLKATAGAGAEHSDTSRDNKAARAAATRAAARRVAQLMAQAAPMVLNLEDLTDSTPEVLQMEMGKMSLEELLDLDTVVASRGRVATGARVLLNQAGESFPRL
ncbi:hypothetical protein FOA52_000282 [Chlamydomonas sp. UWO 241]|nr:hypothetical protein FOA52_000282 [Chlamydomonas sp. UWO 241]